MLLGTDLCIGVLRRRPQALAWVRGRTPDLMLVSTITLFELQRGVAGAHDPQAEQQRVDIVLKPMVIAPFDVHAARRSGQVASSLDRIGKGNGPFDTLLAGHALALDETLVTANIREFNRVQGLRLEDWSTQRG
jgi:tRNA(fMet)-specific endonuclease VapC